MTTQIRFIYRDSADALISPHKWLHRVPRACEERCDYPPERTQAACRRAGERSATAAQQRNPI